MESDTPDIRRDIVVVGANLAALHVLSRLPDSILQDVLVVDRCPWLASWQEKCSRSGTQILRSPVTQHPHKNPNAFPAYLALQSNTAGVECMVSANSLLDFCKSHIIAGLPSSLQNVMQDIVTSIVPDASGGLTAYASSGVSSAGSVPVIKSNGHHHGTLEAPCQQNEAAPVLALPDAIDLRSQPIAGQHVLVVGGGMTSAQLALGAIERGACGVVLICRHQLACRDQEVEAGWLGPKLLTPFCAQRCPRARMRVCREARHHASISPHIWARLQAACRAGFLRIEECAEVAAAQQRAARWRVQLVHCPSGKPGTSENARWELPDLGSWSMPCRGECGLVRQNSADARAASAACVAAQTAPGSEESASAEVGVPAELNATAVPAEVPPSDLPCELWADQIWLATGTTLDIGADSVLAGLQRTNPIRLVGGFPVLDDATLVWPGTPVLLAGRATALSMGPAAGSMGGMRMAADRIARHLSACRKRRAGYVVGASMDKLTEEDAALDALIPFEHQGPMPPLPAPKKKAPGQGLLDVSGLTRGQRLVEVAKYAWSDDGFQLAIVVTLGEPVPKPQVHVAFARSAVELWALGERMAYHLHLPKLYSVIMPERCTFRVSERTQRVELLLHKQADAAWRFLKG